MDAFADGRHERAKKARHPARLQSMVKIET
jgi:hypothetical protein